MNFAMVREWYCVQEMCAGRVKIPRNSRKSIFSKNRLKAGNEKKNKTTFTLTTFKVVGVKVVLFFKFPLLSRFSDVF